VTFLSTSKNVINHCSQGYSLARSWIDCKTVTNQGLAIIGNDIVPYVGQESLVMLKARYKLGERVERKTMWKYKIIS